MIKIILKSFNDSKLNQIINIDPENIPAGDIPYYVIMEKQNSGVHKVEFQFINHAEQKVKYADEIVKVVFGKNSGKVYEFELNPNTYINSHKLKLVRKKLVSGGNNLRFENNIGTLFNVLNEIFRLFPDEFKTTEKEL